MLESESSRTNFSIVVKYYVRYELLSTDTIMLTAVTFNLNLHKLFDLVIKVKNRSLVTIARIGPGSISNDKVLELGNPWENGRNDSIVQTGKSSLNVSHGLQVFRYSVVDILED